MDRQVYNKIFEEVFRVSQFTMFTSGLKEFTRWIKYKEPDEILYWHKINCFGKTSHLCNINVEPILVYGDIGNLFPFVSNCISEKLNQGAMRGKELVNNFPHPKPLELYKKLLLNYTKKIEIVLDCFMGSGTTASACESLGINYIGFEKNKEYINDIKKRIKLGISQYKIRQPKGMMNV